MNAYAAARIRVGLTQTEAASRVGVCQNFIAKIEFGSKKPSVETLRRLADAYGVTTDALLGRAPLPSPEPAPAAAPAPQEVA